MEAIPKDYKMLIYELIEGRVNLAILNKIALFLAKVHNGTYLDKKIEKQFPISQMYERCKIGLYHQEYLNNSTQPIIRKKIQEAISIMRNRRIVLLHGDMFPKNILSKGNNFFVVDYEFSVYGDPAHDVSLFTTILLLCGIINFKNRKKYYQAIQVFIKTYRENITFKEILESLNQNVILHIAPHLYGRFFGTAKIDFYDKDSLTILRKFLDTISLSNVESYKDVFSIVDEVCAPLKNYKPMTKEDYHRGVVF